MSNVYNDLTLKNAKDLIEDLDDFIEDHVSDPAGRDDLALQVKQRLLEALESPDLERLYYLVNEARYELLRLAYEPEEGLESDVY